MATAAGLSRNQVTQRLGNGKWRRLVKGAYCVSAQWEQASDEERHVLLARAVLLTRGETSPIAFSHVTAGVLHGLPLPATALGTVWMTAATGYDRTTRYTRVLRREVAALSPEDLCRLDGLPATSMARTVADCLRHLPLTESVPLADAALHAGSLELAHVQRVLHREASWPFAETASRAIPFVDGRRESVLESRSGIVIQQHGLPAPTPQVKIFDANGRFVARSDFGWPKYGVIGEADGTGKYTDDPIAVLQAEKDRQAALEGLGLVVVRWGWRHLYGDPPELVARVRRALQAGDPRRFRGTVA
jgi:hypothetical protein